MHPSTTMGHCPRCLKHAASSSTNFTSRLSCHLLQQALLDSPSGSLLPDILSPCPSLFHGTSPECNFSMTFLVISSSNGL